MKAKRKRHSATFKAKVALDALIGVKTVAQIARENNIHPIQVSQWKTTLREHLPDVFDSNSRQDKDQEELIAALHQKIGELTVDLDWLKKNQSNWGFNMSQACHRRRFKPKPAPSVPALGPLAQFVLLRAMPGIAQKSAAHAAVGSLACGPSILRRTQASGSVASRGFCCQSQASGTAPTAHGHRGNLSPAQARFERTLLRQIPVFTQQASDQWTRPSVVQRHNLCSYDKWFYVSGGSDGLVEPLRAFLEIEQYVGRPILHRSLEDGATARTPKPADLQHRSGSAIHQPRLHRRGGSGRLLRLLRDSMRLVIYCEVQSVDTR